MALGYKFYPQSHLFFGDVISELFNLITNIVRYFFVLIFTGENLALMLVPSPRVVDRENRENRGQSTIDSNISEYCALTPV